jgi:hypothetical protein
MITQEQTYEKAVDTAGTIISFRQSGALPTIVAMRGFIVDEQKLNKLDASFCILTEDFVKDANEWYDRESEPDDE